ncbi:uncharacterized protein LOC106461059 isoform X2 [Limulus polyphemus]|nr:uncharacterized protein LOC106461059 isoform X2 [Limulus polyphemus]
MYDTLVGNNKKRGDRDDEDGSSKNDSQLFTSGLPNQHRVQGSRGRTRYLAQRSFSVNDTYNKRPLSTSSVSSSSSSSSSSLPRNGMDVKRSYLASIESLEDDSDPDETKGSHLGRSNVHGLIDVQAPYNPGLRPTDRVVMEIVDSERTYVKDLHEIIEGYFQHILSARNELNKETLTELFGNIEDIYKFNSAFLEELEACGLDSVAVAQCFVRNREGFSIYTQYCTNYPRSVEVLTKLMQNSKTAEIFRDRQLVLHHRLPLGSYLLKPVQRITKYQLLLTNLAKHLDGDGDCYPDIKNAISVMTGIVYYINDMKRKHEDAVRVQEIQSLLYEWEGQDLTTYGELAAEGMFRMFGAKALRHLILFDKMLLIAKQKEEGKLSYKDHILCSNLMLIESIQGEPLCFHVIPFNNPRVQYTFQASNLEQKREWCLELKRVILENYNAVIPSKARQLVMALGQNKEDSLPNEKASSKRLHSAPEYLEKRNQERRKSETSLNKAFKLKKGNKKSQAEKRRKSHSASHDVAAFLSVSSHPGHEEERRASFDIACSQISRTTLESKDLSVNNITTSINVKPGCLSTSKESLSLLPTALNTQNGSNNGKMTNDTLSSNVPKTPDQKARERPKWKAWNSLPGETTDTEVEDNYERIDISRILQLCPPPRPARTEEEILEDLAGEYVTFVFAHRYACRDLANRNEEWSMVPETLENSGNTYDELKNQSSVETINCGSSESTLPTDVGTLQQESCHQKNKKVGNYDNLFDLWNKLGTVHMNIENSGETSSSSSESSFKQSASVRRVHSFTGMAKTKDTPLHNSLSFKQPFKDQLVLPPKPTVIPQPQTSEEVDLFSVPPPPVLTSKDSFSPIPSTVCLKKQQHHQAEFSSTSLPRSFQLVQDYNSECSSGYQSDKRDKMSVESNQNDFIDQRPFTIASEKPLEENLIDDLERYIASSSQTKQTFKFPVNSEDNLVTCATTCASSMDNISIHPEYKVYRQQGSRYATLRTVISNVSSKISVLKATFGSPMIDQTDNTSVILDNSASLDRSMNMEENPANQSCIRTGKDFNNKVPKTRFVSSLARAYSIMRKQRLQKEGESTEIATISNISTTKKDSINIHKTGSSIIGARMAGLHDSEYCVPSSLFLCQQLRSDKEEEVCPDSLLSDSSNTTSSSDVDKTFLKNNLHDTFKVLVPQRSKREEKVLAQNGECSENNIYERSFEAIEGTAMMEDFFRDSAIYSDPESEDFSTVESSPGNCEMSECHRTLKQKQNHEREDNEANSSSPEIYLTKDNANNSKATENKTDLCHPKLYTTQHFIEDNEDKNFGYSPNNSEYIKIFEPYPVEVLSTRPVKGSIIEKLKNIGGKDLTLPTVNELEIIQKRQKQNDKMKEDLTLLPSDSLRITKQRQKEDVELQKELPPPVDVLKVTQQRQKEGAKFQKELILPPVDVLKVTQQKQKDGAKLQKELMPPPVNVLKITQQRQKEGAKLQKEVIPPPPPLDRLKTIKQRQLELLNWCTQKGTEDYKDDEIGSEYSNTHFNTVTEIEVDMPATASSLETPDSPPLPAKGWVKHIVNKFQNENQT